MDAAAHDPDLTDSASPDDVPPDDSDAVAARRLADGLRDAFARLAQSPLTPDEKARWQQRLLAVTNSAKRDTSRSLASLARFNDDWNREFPS